MALRRPTPEDIEANERELAEEIEVTDETGQTRIMTVAEAFLLALDRMDAEREQQQQTEGEFRSLEQHRLEGGKLH